MLRSELQGERWWGETTASRRQIQHSGDVEDPSPHGPDASTVKRGGSIPGMWKAPEEIRLRRAADWLVRNVPELWHVSEHKDEYGRYVVRPLLPPPQRAYYDATFEGLAREFGATAIEQVVPELFFFAADGLFRDGSADRPPEWWMLRKIAHDACRIWTLDHAPDYAVDLAVARLRHIVCNGLAVYETTPTWGSAATFHPPDEAACASLLVEWSDRPAARAAIRELLDGAWDRPLDVPLPIREAWEASGSAHLVREYEGSSTYAYFKISEVLRHGALELAARDELTVARLHDLARYKAEAVPVHVAARDREPQSDSARAAAPIVNEFLWQIMQDLSERTLELAASYAHVDLHGARFVVKACEHIEARGISSLTAEEHDKLPKALRWLADAHLDAGETVEALAAQLARFKPVTLRTALPHAPATVEAFFSALGWTAALPLLRLTRRIAARTCETTHASDAPNSPDPASGVVDRAEVEAALRVAGPELARDLMVTLRAGRIKIDNTTKLVEAVGGRNRKEIEKGLNRLVQIDLKALGLLPLEHGAEEVVERYRRLRHAARDCRKYGPERQTNTQAAVLAGLANLAQTAGYDDVSRMEWAVESQIAEASADPRARVGEYEAAVEMPDLDPRVVVRRADRVLASVPPAVRKAKEYVALRDTAVEMKAQVTRFRRSLEDMMTEGRAFTAADLAGASRLPALERLVGRLVLRRPDGTTGLLVGGSLCGLDDATLPLVDGIQVAHPTQLISDGILRAWQRAIVAGRVVQPFKQVFREVYALTDAELGANETARFAGHRLDGRVLRRLLSARGWEVESGDAPLPFRRYRAAGLGVWFDFPDARHFFGGDEPVTSGSLSFRMNGRVPLAQVPAAVVSEAFRDADLMVAVARAGDEALSAESYERRGDTVVALAELLGVPGVEREGRFVRVRGQLARYRVHLGSGAVCVEPANVVCILPETRRKKADGIWLPFAEEDERLAEVVSKVVLLAADDSIEDAAIRAQIEAAGGR